MKKEQMKMGEKTIETPTLLIKKNIMASRRCKQPLL